jgi:hypothetical protein
MTSISASVDSSYNNPLNQQPLPEGKGCATGIEELKVGNFLKISNAPPQYNTPEDMNAYWGEVRSSYCMFAVVVGCFCRGSWWRCTAFVCSKPLSASSLRCLLCVPCMLCVPCVPMCLLCSSQRYLHPTPSTTPPPVRRAIHSRNPGPRPRRARQTIRHVDQRPGVSSGI